MEGPTKDCKVQRLSVNTEENNKDKNDSHLLDGELVLRDMMDSVCQYLNIHELCHVLQVCRSWNDEASRELEKRDFQLPYVLPYLFSKQLMDSSYRVSKILKCKPYVTLLFPGTNRLVGDVRDEVDLEYDTFKTYKKQFPNKLIVVGVFEAMLDENLIHSCPVLRADHVVEKYIPAGTLSLSLPTNKRLDIKESHILESDFLQNGVEEYDSMINKLIPDCLDSKSTLIIFVSNADGMFTYRDDKLNILINKIKQRFTPKSFTLWGLVSTYKIFATDSHNRRTDSEEETRFVGLNLTGPNLESWSTVIRANLTKNELKRKLYEFKDRIRLKQYNVGLITAPVIIEESYGDLCYISNNRELVHTVKKIFPEIPFLGTFCEEEDSYFGSDCLSEDSDELMSNEIISIMIFGYD